VCNPLTSSSRQLPYFNAMKIEVLGMVCGLEVDGAAYKIFTVVNVSTLVGGSCDYEVILYDSVTNQWTTKCSFQSDETWVQGLPSGLRDPTHFCHKMKLSTHYNSMICNNGCGLNMQQRGNSSFSTMIHFLWNVKVGCSSWVIPFRSVFRSWSLWRRRQRRRRLTDQESGSNLM